ncbi:MAG TPA: uracil-DNA glycosylase [Clostridiaceae bacterium]|nr:uracil-DNA glycosylase [Clostridiaceae bacterium]
MGKELLLNAVENECIEAVNNKYPDEQKVIVFGEGNADADIALVGEAPGEKEIKYKRPFAGAAGKNLDEFLDILGLKREDIYITNTVKFRPVKINPKTLRLSNRPPEKDEIALCLPFLQRQLDIIKPKIVVTLGNTPLRALTGDNKITIGKCHGTLIEECRYDIFPLYHPASILYNMSLKEVYNKDLLKFKKILKDNG